jgi:enoyl-CoA hydratase/carnithine racemase
MTTERPEVVLVKPVGATRVVTMNRPEARNALTLEVLGKLRQAFDTASTDAAVRCVVLRGAGEHFCSGADLRKTLLEDPQLLQHLDGYMDEFHGVIKSVVRCTKPVIAMMDGAAVGFGADLAFACDLRTMTRRAYVQEKFVHIGLMPDGGGSFWLPRLVGTARAMRMILLAEKVTAEELEHLGVASVTDPDAIEATTLDLAKRLEAGPPLAFAAIKRAVYASLGSVEDALRREREEQLKLLRSEDVMEGVAAWMQKREARFQGK